MKAGWDRCADEPEVVWVDGQMDHPHGIKIPLPSPSLELQSLEKTAAGSRAWGASLVRARVSEPLPELGLLALTHDFDPPYDVDLHQVLRGK